MENKASALLVGLTGIAKKDIDSALEKNTLSEVLMNPGLIRGTSRDQLRRLEALNEFARAYSAAGHSYTLESDPGQIARYLYGLIGGQRQETLVVLLYDKNKELVRAEKISKGGIASTYLDLIVLGRIVAENDAKHLILAHNHPSGDTRLSTDDVNTAESLRKMLPKLGCTLEDAYVIGDNVYSTDSWPVPREIPRAQPETVLFPSAQKEEDEVKIQDLLSKATGVRRSIIERLRENGHALSGVMGEPQASEYGLVTNDSGKIKMATEVVKAALKGANRTRPQIDGPATAANVAQNYASRNDIKAGVLFLDTRHRVLGKKEIAWPITTYGCRKIADDSYKHNATALLVFRMDENTPVKETENDRTSAQKVYSYLAVLGLDVCDILILPQNNNQAYLSLREKGYMTLKDTDTKMTMSEPPREATVTRRAR